MHEDGRKSHPTLSHTIAHEPLAFSAAFVELTQCGIFRTPCVISRSEVPIRSETNSIHLFAPSSGGTSFKMQIQSASPAPRHAARQASEKSMASGKIETLRYLLRRN
jgi:hypothetical protein